MRILVHGINYSPELTGIGKYTGEMCEWLGEQGHEVTVITAYPYYPEWQIHPSYSGKFWHKEVVNNVVIYRCPLYVPKNVTSAKRILHEFSFLLSTLPIWILLIFSKKFDTVFAISPPFHLGFLPLLYGYLKGSKVINHIQDLQVDAAKELGMIKNTFFLNLMFSMEKFILQSSSKVSTISLGMQRKIEAKGIPSSDIIQFPNWVDEKQISPLSKEKSLRNEFNLMDDDQVVLYSGNLGDKQGLEIIIEVAKDFASYPKVKFLICGTGGAKQKLVDLAKEKNLANIFFHPLQPYEKLSALLATADIHLVLQKKSASDLVLPSKLTGILAAGGCAIITAVEGTTLYDIVKKHRVGILCEPESRKDLYKAIQIALSIDQSEIKANARFYATQFLSKESVLQSFTANLNALQKKALVEVQERVTIGS